MDSMKTVIGLFDDFPCAHAAVDALLFRKFDRADVSLIANEVARSRSIAEAELLPDVVKQEGPALGDRRTAASAGGMLGMLAGFGALTLPAIGFPAGFLVDLHFWMSRFGQNLDPSAPLSSSVKPFTPTVLGEGGIGQFKTYATLEPGFYVASAAAAVLVVALVFHRRAYKPLHDRLAAPGKGAAA